MTNTIKRYTYQQNGNIQDVLVIMIYSHPKLIPRTTLACHATKRLGGSQVDRPEFGVDCG